MATEQTNEEDIFRKAIQFENRREQANYVKKACGDNVEMYSAVEALLQHHYTSSILDSPILEQDMILDESPLSEGPGTVIGRYKLLEKIGEGGMAVVYMAEQRKPICRKVALKIIKLGMDTKQVIARFEAERQALAMMDHPNIAKVLDAGATETGRPYFVMELVTGVSITEYCDKNNLSTKERLALFIQVCNAVQHAHQKGIIHRDIKPSNIMVTRHEGKAVPKIIDFGIAKATNQRLTEKTIFTRYAHIIGTPAYMSPEQADFGDTDVDTRSDIYSLGVLLYELLTGTTPFSEEQLREAGYIEMQRIIREKEPAKPSTKLSTLGKTLTDIAKHRGCTLDLLTKSIRGDLDWIVMKALEKIRDRRYETVSALTMDVERHLKDEPILARAPSTIYYLRKFLRRHQSSAAAILLTSVFAVILLAVFLAWSYKNMEAQISLTHRDSLIKALDSLWQDNLDAALAYLEPILGSKYVGSEALTLRDKILNSIREQVSDYTEEINLNPGDAENYLLRAQLYYWLSEKNKMIADMEMYVNILNPLDETNRNDMLFRDFLISLWQGTPTVITSNFVTAPSVSTDGLSLYVDAYEAPGGYGDWDLFVYTRETIHDDWSGPVNLGPLFNSSAGDGNPDISYDGLSLFFNSSRSGGYGDRDIYVSTRATENDPWSEPMNLGPTINGPHADAHPSISTDGLTLFFTSDRPDGYGDRDIYVSTRATENDDWSEPVNLGPIVNSSSWDSGPDISSNGLMLFFESERPGGYGYQDIWVTTRAKKEDDWGVPVNLGPIVNNSRPNYTSYISADGSTLYWWSQIGRLREISVATSSDVFQEDSHD